MYRRLKASLEMEPDAARSSVTAPIAPAPPMRWQPKAGLCRMLAVLWIFPSAGAVLILAVTEARWRHAEGLGAVLGAIKLEQWVALALLLAHPILAWQAWHLRRTEPWKEIVPEPEPGPDAGLQDPE